MQLNLKPSHDAVKAYYTALNELGQLHFDHEMAVRSAFQDLLSTCGRKLKLTLVPEYRIERAKSSVIVDGALFDTFHLAHGYWEAKDERDDLDREVQRKLDKGYPKDNTIFQAPERAILYQAGARIADEDISKSDYLVQIVNQFFDYRAPFIEEWEEAVNEFSERIPELAGAVFKIIEEERKRNPAFVRSFDDFYALCQQAINPNLSPEAVERMLVQHLLTERIFRTIFHNPDFTRRNVVAQEIEKVIAALTSRSFNRDEFLSKLDRFYKAIEFSAENTTGFSEKQAFLNKVYERFFQGYSPKEADTHGIVYTPQPIVNFMVRSVEEILKKEFGRSLSDQGVHILDPFVGTGNFIVRIMQEIKTTALPYKYENELHCNEVMLLPYYIASMNIEKAYIDRTGEYKAFPGLCLVDTFELAEPEQSSLGFMTEENAHRVKRQKEAPIFVIIGNPPYNAWQVNENDNNKNRTYKYVNSRIAATYSKASRASNKNALADPYVKAIRWATDRLGSQGLVCFITNNGFIDNIAFDGMRTNLARDFDAIHVINLHGNIRKDSMRDKVPLGEEHTVFGLAAMVGISLSLFVKGPVTKRGIFYTECNFRSTREEKFKLLERWSSWSGVPWHEIRPDGDGTWLTEGMCDEFKSFVSIGPKSIFEFSSNALKTNRDVWMYNFQKDELENNVNRLVETYSSDVARRRRSSAGPREVDLTFTNDPTRISWSETLKNKARRGLELNAPVSSKMRDALYRPFALCKLYFDADLNERRYGLPSILPTANAEQENELIALSNVGFRSPFSALATNHIPEMHLCATTDGFVCFSFYTYSEDGSNRRENITDWALKQFRTHYHDPSISKWDIFHYVYAVLHHPEYRQRYAANLRRELPRIPFVRATGAKAPGLTADDAGLKPGSSTVPHASRPVKKENSDDGCSAVEERPFRAASPPSEAGASAPVESDLDVFRVFVATGKRLAEIHVNYEQQCEYPLTRTEKAGEKLDWRVTKMRLSKDKTSLIYNQFLTLSGIPPQTYEYRLGNRSALDWVIDQYQVSTDKRSGITNDPNRADDPQYIVRLIGQVVTVSLETVKIVASLPNLGIETALAKPAATV